MNRFSLPLSLISLISVLSVIIITSLVFFYKKNSNEDIMMSLSNFPLKNLAFSKHNLKQVILVRMDLKMGVGKIAAQCGHASLASYKQLFKSVEGKKILNSWEESGQAKIVLKVTDERSMLEIAQKARKGGVNVAVVRDAGRTQIAAGSITVCAIGPHSAEEIDKYTGHLKLL